MTFSKALSVPAGCCLVLLFAASFLPPSRTGGSPSGMKASPADFDTIRTDLRDYIWPTNASTRVTSTFAEYRTAHFHGGIDISTNGQPGYPVFAVRDGYVYRVHIMPTGFGKMLFIRHNDGYYSTYAHLKGFNSAITAAVREAQYKRGTYEIDLYPSPHQMPVRKGETVAFSGNTGYGPPHLHFEIRDEHLNPLNPLLCANYAVTDNIPPRIRRVMIAPLTFNSTVDNSTAVKFLSRFPGRGGNLRIPQTIHVRGEIGFGVETIDRSEGSWNKKGVHGLDFFLDDSLVYTMRLDRLPAEETKLIDLHYDYPSIYRGHGKFQKLYIDKGNTLPFYKKMPEGSGVISTEQLKEGEHPFRIVCLDLSGNRTELAGTLLVNHAPVIRVGRTSGAEILLEGEHLESVDRCLVWGKKNFASEWSQHTLGKGRFERTHDGLLLPVDMKSYEVLKIIAESDHGIRSEPVFYFLQKPQNGHTAVNIGKEVFNDYVRVVVTTPGVFTEPPVLVVQEGPSSQKVRLQAVDLCKYTGAFLPSPSFAGERTLKVEAQVNGAPSGTETTLELFSIPENASGRINTGHGGMVLSYDSGAVFRPVHIEVDETSGGNSPIFQLSPADVLLDRGVTVSLPCPAGGRTDHLGLYFRTTGGWMFQTADRDSGGRTFSASFTRTLGDVALFHDAEPPSIGRLRVVCRGGKPSISFRYHDNLSGVDTDEIKMYIDGTLVIPEVDGEHHNVRYEAADRLGRGRHLLHLTMKDRTKNESTFDRNFTVR